MATRPAVTVRAINRERLSSFLKSPDLIRAFEALAKDVGQTLPDATFAATETAEGAASDAAEALGAAAAALAAANAAADLAQAVQDALDAAGLPLAGETAVNIPALAYQHEETVSVPGVTGTMQILLGVAPHSDADTNHETMLDVAAMAGQAGTDQITVRLAFGSQTSGVIRLNYMAV